LELRGDAGQAGSRGQSLLGAGCGSLSDLRDAENPRGDRRGAVRGLREIIGDIQCGGGLLLSGGGDRVGRAANLVHYLADLANRRDGLSRVALNRVDTLVGGAGCLFGQLFDFVRHHHEAFPGLTGTGGLDRGVQRQQVGLLGDRADDPHYLANIRAALRQAGHSLIGFSMTILTAALVV
jgi:hypothetical protein